MNIGFIGLGNMGSPMALNLIKAGHSVIAFDLNAAAVQQVQSAGANGVDSTQALVQEKPEVIITMLPTGAHVKQVYLGEQGILDQLADNTLLIDCSTIDPATAREVAQEAKAKGIEMLDAPVSGGTIGAQAGTLTFMVGGSAEGFERAHTVLSAMGKNIVHCGVSGNGQVAKVANNMLLGISMVGVAEAMNLGVNLGMNPKVLAGIINTSSGRCWSSEVNNPWPGVLEAAPAGRDYQGGFFTDLMLKDMRLALEAARQVNSSVTLGKAAEQLYALSSEQGNGRIDFSSVLKLIQAGKF